MTAVLIPVEVDTTVMPGAPHRSSAEMSRRASATPADAALAALDAWLDIDLDRVSTGAKSRQVELLASVEAKVAAMRMRLMAHGQDAARAEGHRDTAAWYAAHTHADTGVARFLRRAANELQAAPVVAAALAAGQVSERQARVIVEALDALPPVPPALKQQAAETLVSHARTLAPRDLVERGKGVLDEIDPSGEHHQLETTVTEEDIDAWAETRVTIRDRGNGLSDVDAVLPTAAAQRLKHYLEALTNPRRNSVVEEAGRGRLETPDVDRVPHATRLGRAFCTLLEHMDPAGLPQHGGMATTLIITMDHHDLMSDLGVAGLLDGHGTAISGAEARRLACGAGIIPAVLGSKSEVLDLGRTARLFSPAQVKALRVNQPTCRAEGCDIPSPWTEAHHLDPWSHGGSTNLIDGVLLCSHHHHLIHDPRYHHQRQPSGRIRFRLRT